MKIGDIDLNEHILLVAEIGNNHEGRFAVASEMVQRAAESGAHAVKFQTFRTEHYISAKDSARFARLKSFELTIDQFGALSQLAHSLGMLFLSTPFDLHSARGLETLVDAFKIASGDNNFFPLIRQTVATGLPTIISTGVSDHHAIAETVDFVTDILGPLTHSRVALLHCVSAYPAPLNEVNLRAIAYLQQRFGLTVGYSDHSLGLRAATLAAAAGARIIEKHFTLDKNLSDFRDHQLSADPQELSELAQQLAEIQLILGHEKKGVTATESANQVVIRRSIAAAGDFSTGHTIQANDLTWLRPGTGVSPGNEHLFIGHKLRRSVASGEFLQPTDVE